MGNVKNFLKFFESHDFEDEYDFDENKEVGVLINKDLKSKYEYLDDAIVNGLIENYFDLDVDLIEEFDDVYSYGVFTNEELGDLIKDDFENVIDNIFSFLIDKGIIKEKENIQLLGTDENGDSVNFSYSSK